MQRQVMERLRQWKNRPDRKPLLLMGARQVGKTWIMKEFGQQQYKKTAYISFFNNTRMTDVFEQDYDVQRIIQNLNIEARTEITPHDTLIIFDEVQEVPKVLESLKYFCEQAPEYHIVAAGSLLGVALHKGISFPVGKVEIMDIYPMNFREFLLAMGEEQLEGLLSKKDYGIISNFTDRYLFLLKNYYYTGGMPAVVDFFRQHRDYQGVRDIQKSILRQYKADFGKHITARELPRINMVWDSILVQLAKENKKFFFGQIKKGGRSADFEIAVQWLSDCGLIHRVYRVNEPHIPLAAYKTLTAYKLFLVDVGLLGAIGDLDSMTLLEGSSVFVEFKGALTEQYVLQQILSDTNYKPYYYGTEKATFEQDFMLQIAGRAVPIEVKAAANVQSQSLKAYCAKFHPEKAIRISARNYQEQDYMVNIPLYAVCNI